MLLSVEASTVSGSATQESPARLRSGGRILPSRRPPAGEPSSPAAAAVQQWYADCARASHQPFGEHSRRIYLVWTNGEIDYERSYIDVFDFCRPSGALSIHTGQPLLNLASGTFRARKPDPEVAPAARA